MRLINKLINFILRRKPKPKPFRCIYIKNVHPSLMKPKMYISEGIELTDE